MRLIDADAFEQELKEKLLPLHVKKYGKEEAMKGLHFSLHDCISSIQGQPTITQPEIIRCKNCKWSDWYDSTDGNRYCYCMETGAAGRAADDFCSYAERRTDERFNQQTGGD